MTTEEQQTMDELSRTITQLCEAIDPSFTHGPETKKLVEYAESTRRLALESAVASFGTNRVYQHNKASEIFRHLNYTLPTNGGISEG